MIMKILLLFAVLFMPSANIYADNKIDIEKVDKIIKEISQLKENYIHLVNFDKNKYIQINENPFSYELSFSNGLSPKNSQVHNHSKKQHIEFEIDEEVGINLHFVFYKG